MYKHHNVSIKWLKQRSGNYALKGIMISEGDKVYDSSSSFREEDAIWVTSILGADPDVEVSANNSSTFATNNVPEWARAASDHQSPVRVPPLELEKANTSVLRHSLESLIAACGGETAESAVSPTLCIALQSAALALQETDTGVHFTLAAARAILNSQKPNVLPSKGRK